MPFPPASASRKPRRPASARPAGAPSALVAFKQASAASGSSPGPRRPRRRHRAHARPVFAAAAAAFSRDGFDGVSVDDIARAAGVNKAMLYYHFEDKLGALPRSGARHAARAWAPPSPRLPTAPTRPPRKIERFIETLAAMREARPWFPPLMMREMAAGAPHLDADTLALMRACSSAFASILEAGVAAGDFRPVQPGDGLHVDHGPADDERRARARRRRAGPRRICRCSPPSTGASSSRTCSTPRCACWRRTTPAMTRPDPLRSAAATAVAAGGARGRAACSRAGRSQSPARLGPCRGHRGAPGARDRRHACSRST